MAEYSAPGSDAGESVVLSERDQNRWRNEQTTLTMSDGSVDVPHVFIPGTGLERVKGNTLGLSSMHTVADVSGGPKGYPRGQRLRYIHGYAMVEAFPSEDAAARAREGAAHWPVRPSTAPAGNRTGGQQQPTPPTQQQQQQHPGGAGGMRPSLLPSEGGNPWDPRVDDTRPTTSGGAPVAPFVPAFVARRGVVLRFFGVIEEKLSGAMSYEESRERLVEVNYYPENGKLEIVEPKVDNSMLDQGTLLRKMKLLKPGGREFMRGGDRKSVNQSLWHVDEDYYTEVDLHPGATVEAYGYKVQLRDCDAFTRAYYKDVYGVTLPEGRPMPNVVTVDPVDGRVIDLDQRRYKDPTVHGYKHVDTDDALRGRRKGGYVHTSAKYDKYSGVVLCFLATWFDGDEIRRFEIHCYLENDQLEVVETRKVNSGRDPNPVLIRRQFVGKKRPTHVMQAQGEAFTWRDMLPLGKEVSILGRNFHVHDTNQHTREWLRCEKGISVTPVPSKAPAPKAVRGIYVPEHTGIGSEEDSLQSVLSLTPRTVQSNWMDKANFADQILRFRAQLVGTGDIYDSTRPFVVSYFLADGTVGVFEDHDMNSGYRGGHFLRRSIVPNPEAPGRPYRASDMRVGAALNLFGHHFVLEATDPATEALLASPTTAGR